MHIEYKPAGNKKKRMTSHLELAYKSLMVGNLPTYYFLYTGRHSIKYEDIF